MIGFLEMTVGTGILLLWKPRSEPVTKKARKA